MAFALDKLIDKSEAGTSFKDLTGLSVSSLKGVSENDAALLQEAFGIKSLGDLGNNRFFMAAQAIYRATLETTFDQGPPPFWAGKLAGLSDDYFINHPSQRFRTAFGGVLYRGRLDDTARILVIGQDPSTDEALARRAFVGSAGQRLQKFLNKIGITRSYIIINAFAYSITGQFDTQMKGISLEPPLKTFREGLMDTILDRNPIEAILTFGAGARHAVENWGNPRQVRVFNLVHPTAPEVTTHPSWNENLPVITGFIEPDDPQIVDLSTYSGNWDKTMHHADIPRYDLPYGLPSWHGSGGTRSRRDPADKVKNIIWESP